MSAREGALSVNGAWRAQWPRIRGWLPLAGLGLAVVLALGGFALPRATVAFQIGALALFIASVVALRRDIWTAALICVLAVVIDYYQLVEMPKGFPFVGLLTIILLLAVIGFTQREARPWALLPDLPWWGILLALVALAIPRSLNLTDAVIYFLAVFVTALGAWAVGFLVMTDVARLRLLLNLLTVIGVLVGIHSILDSQLGIFLLDTPKHQAYMQLKHNFYFLVKHHYVRPARASSFLLNPDSDGAFLAMMLFLPAGLFFAARTYWQRALYLLAVVIILVGLLVTYTAAAFVAAAVGVVALVVLAVRPRHAALAFGGVLVLGALGVLVFPTETARLFHHATGPHELSLRIAIWQTALKIIHAYPLTGIGLGTGAPYIARSAPFIAGMHTGPVPHPHNVYLELAALAGIPVLLAYLVVLGRSLWRAFKTYWLADWSVRPLLAGVFAALVALSVHGLADATWTLPPLVPIAWLLVGAISSVRLRDALEYETLTRGSGPAIAVRYPASETEHTPAGEDTGGASM